MRILKIGSCPSVSGKSTLTYHIGCNTESDIHLRVYANTSAGFFSKEWLALDSIHQALTQAGSHFTSFALQPLFKGKSQNNSAFLLAVLLCEGLLETATDKKRCYGKSDPGHFIAEIKALMASEISLKDDDKPAANKKASSKKKSSNETEK